MSRASATPAGTLVLDSEGLAKAVLRAREVTQWLALALADDLRVITSAATVVEVAHPRLNRPALEWTLSRVVVEPVTEPIARRATAILAEAGLHGHRHAIDAMLSATALAAPGPVTVLTSDPEDIATLCGRNVTVIKVLRDGPGAKRAGRAGSAAARPAGMPCPRPWQAFAERGGEAEFGAQPFSVDRSFAPRGGEPGLVFELTQQALQPECLCRAALAHAATASVPIWGGSVADASISRAVWAISSPGTPELSRICTIAPAASESGSSAARIPATSAGPVRGSSKRR